MAEKRQKKQAVKAFEKETFSKDKEATGVKHTENIKVKIIGSRDGLSEKMKDSISKCMERTKDNTGITFNIALNYGGRDELLKAVKNISEQVKENKLNIEEKDRKWV